MGQKKVVFPAGNFCQDGNQLFFIGIDVLLAKLPHESQGILVVKYRKILTDFERFMLLTDDIQAQIMEGRDNQTLGCLIAKQFTDTVFHLFGGLVGKGYRSNLIGTIATFGD